MSSLHTLTKIEKALELTNLQTNWYRWCDTSRDWSVEAKGVYEKDSLRSEHGGFTPLHIDEFTQAYRDAGANVTKTATDKRFRSFRVEVAAGKTVCMLDVRLGRGINTEECRLLVSVEGVAATPLTVSDDGKIVTPLTLLHDVARTIVMANDPTAPDPLYPRPIISSHSHLEVTSREIVAMLKQVADEWAQ